MSGDTTIQALKRLSWLPDRDSEDNGTLIAGQEYYDVEFAGGSISNVVITDSTLNGVSTTRNSRVVTTSGDITVQPDDYIIEVDKTVGQATTVELPANPALNRSVLIKDLKGDAQTNNITIDGNGNNIDGASNATINTNFGARELAFNGSEWAIITSYKDASGGGGGAVDSVNGQTGTVVLDIDDIGGVVTDGTTITGDGTSGNPLVAVASGGTVETVSIASSNGFAGTSDGDPVDPVLTLSTTVTGLLKGNGTAISAAVAGTDYVTASSTNTFTNKTFDADGTGNSITNIENADIKAGAAIAVNKLAALTANRAVITDGSGFIAPATTTATEIGYVNGVTSAIQTQLNGKQATGSYITALTGDVTASGPGSVAATIANNAVSNAKFRQSGAYAVVGNATGSTANVADITASTAGHVMRFTGSALQFGAVDLAGGGDVTGVLDPSRGGTGVNNASRTITISGNFNLVGNNNLTLTVTGATNVTLPTTGTLATLAGAEALTNKSVNGVTLSSSGLSGFFLDQTGTYSTPVFNTPLTTKGDIYTFSTVDTRLPVGTDGYVLTADSGAATGLSWQPSGGGGGSVAFSAITGGTNTTASMVVGSGATLSATGTGTITATAVPVGGITGLGTGVATFLATPSSANLAAAVTDETGSGALVFATSPTLTTPTIAKIANLTTNGFVKTTSGDGTLTVDTGSYQPLDGTLTALAAYNTNGILTQTAADTFTGRTITGTTNSITVTNGNGVSGNPTLAVSSTYAGGSSIATVGTITSGTWNGTAIAANRGGTGQTVYAVGDLLYASTTTALSKLADVAAGSYLRSGGVNTAPVWSTTTLPNSATTGDVLYASASNVYSNLAGVATGNALISGGVGTAPSWGKIGLTTHVTGTLPVGGGGTGATTLTGIVKGNGGSAFTAATAGTDYVAPGTATVYTAQQNFGSQALTDAATITWNLATQQVANVLLTSGVGATRVLGAPSNMVNGGTYILRVVQSATGSNALTYNAVYKWPGGVAPVLSTANNAVDILTFISDGTNMYGVAQKAFS